MEGMKSTCDKFIIAVKNDQEKGDKNTSSYPSILNSTRMGMDSPHDVNGQNLFDGFEEKMNKSKSDIYNLSSKVKKLEEKSDQNEAIVENLMLISQTINENLVKIEAGSHNGMKDDPASGQISAYKSTACKSVQTRVVNTESRGTSTLKTRMAFNSGNLRPKFVLSQYPKSQHFIDKLTVIAVKSVNEYLIAQDSNGFGMMEYDDVFSQTNGKVLTPLTPP